MAVDRFNLIAGPYQTPEFEYGDIVHDERRGDVEIVAITDGLIPWPIGRRDKRWAIILYDALVDAVRVESNQAVAHWWSVSGQSVTKWRKAIEVSGNTPGTSQLRSDYTQEPHVAIGLKRAHEKSRDGRRDKARRKKIAAAKRGKKRPQHVLDALRESHLGTTHSDATRRKMSRAHKRRGTRPPAAGEPWTAEEDAIVRSTTRSEAAKQTGRTLAAVTDRRMYLGVPDGRRKDSK